MARRAENGNLNQGRGPAVGDEGGRVPQDGEVLAGFGGGEGTGVNYTLTLLKVVDGQSPKCRTGFPGVQGQ